MNSLAWLRINLASVADKWTQGFSDVLTDHQIGNVVLFRRLVVNDHKLGTSILRKHRTPRGRPYQERGSNRQHEVASFGQPSCAPHRVLGHCLTERDGGRLHRLLALDT